MEAKQAEKNQQEQCIYLTQCQTKNKILVK